MSHREILKPLLKSILCVENCVFCFMPCLSGAGLPVHSVSFISMLYIFSKVLKRKSAVEFLWSPPYSSSTWTFHYSSQVRFSFLTLLLGTHRVYCTFSAPYIEPPSVRHVRLSCPEDESCSTVSNFYDSMLINSWPFHCCHVKRYQPFCINFIIIYCNHFKFDQCGNWNLM